jgi:hypothetical protein
MQYMYDVEYAARFRGFIPEPNDDLSTRTVDSTHHVNLSCTFEQVRLIDTQRVDPDPRCIYQGCSGEFPKKLKQIGRHRSIAEIACIVGEED